MIIIKNKRKKIVCNTITKLFSFLLSCNSLAIGQNSCNEWECHDRQKCLWNKYQVFSYNPQENLAKQHFTHAPKAARPHFEFLITATLGVTKFKAIIFILALDRFLLSFSLQLAQKILDLFILVRNWFYLNIVTLVHWSNGRSTTKLMKLKLQSSLSKSRPWRNVFEQVNFSTK